MNVPENIAKRRAAILEIAARHGARNPRLFGSAARGETGSPGDVDILVEMDPDRSLIDLVALERELSGALGCAVDVVVDGGLSPYLKDIIYSEAVAI